MVVSSANNIDLVRIKHPGKSLVYIIQRNGPKTEPWGTPHIMVSM